MDDLRDTGPCLRGGHHGGKHSQITAVVHARERGREGEEGGRERREGGRGGREGEEGGRERERQRETKRERNKEI